MKKNQVKKSQVTNKVENPVQTALLEAERFTIFTKFIQWYGEERKIPNKNKLDKKITELLDIVEKILAECRAQKNPTNLRLLVLKGIDQGKSISQFVCKLGEADRFFKELNTLLTGVLAGEALKYHLPCTFRLEGKIVKGKTIMALDDKRKICAYDGEHFYLYQGACFPL